LAEDFKAELLYFYIILGIRKEVVEMKKNAVDWIAYVLVIVGALNWGFVGLFNFDIVARILGEATALARIVYSLVGLSGLYLIYVVAAKES